MTDQFRNQQDRQGIAAALSLGTQLAVGMACFTMLGVWLDRRRGGGYGFTLGGIFLGLFYCGYEVWKLTRQMQDAEREDDKP